MRLHVRKELNQINKSALRVCGEIEREFEQKHGVHMPQPFTHRHILNASPTLSVIHQV